MIYSNCFEGCKCKACCHKKFGYFYHEVFMWNKFISHNKFEQHTCTFEKSATSCIMSFAGVEIQCIGHFRLLFSLLRLNGCDRVQQFTLEVRNI